MKRAIGLLGVVALSLSMGSACDVVESHAVQVNWTVDGLAAATSCDTYGINYFTATMTGPETFSSTEVSCRGGWTVLMPDPLAGSYEVTVTAHDASGAALATADSTIVVDYNQASPQRVTVAFKAADFAVGGTQSAEVSWTIEGSTATTACDTYGIDNFVVKLDGPDNGNSAAIDCATAKWSEVFPDFTAGSYTVTITAFDDGGGEVGKITTTATLVPAVTPTQISMNFKEADLGAQDNKINIFWNINGTVEGTAKGTSWDACNEVGAKSAVVTVDGNASTHDCDASGNMATTIGGLVDGRTYAITVKLVDATGRDLTTTVSDNIIASAVGGELVADFYFESFVRDVRDTTDGQFHFMTTYEKQSCSATTPPVAYQMTLIRTTDNSAVTNVNVCDASFANCVAADGATPQTCTNLEQVLSILPWGSYTLLLEGATDSDNTCWKFEDSILIGAGTVNPVVDIDLARLSGVTCL